MKKNSKLYKLITTQYVYFNKRQVLNSTYMKKIISLKIKRYTFNILNVSKKQCDKERRKGHRNRVKKEILANGIDSFSDRRLLEALLYYSYPMKDTTDIASNLITKFGSLSTLLNMPPKDLISAGVTEHTAILLYLFTAVARRDNLSRRLDTYITDCDSAKNLCADIMKFQKNEAIYLVCLNSKKVFLGFDKVSEGTITEVAFDLKQVVNIVNQFNALYVILVHNHPSGDSRPSKADITQTNFVKDILSNFNINVLDHIVVGKNETYSFVENSIL